MADPFRLDGRVAVVTGGGKGIGRGIALCLAQAGADVVVVSRTRDQVASVAREVEALGRRAVALAADVTVTESLDAVVAAAAELGGVNLWVNNAGGLPDATPRYLTRTPEDRWDAQIDLNLKAVWQGAVAAAEAMKAQGVTDGAIINISSVAGRGGANVKNGPYAASKAAVNSLTQTLAVELAPAIRVNAIGPGPIPTDNFNESTRFPEGKAIEDVIGVPLKRLGTPDDIGNAVVFLASPASSWITGQCLYVTGGL